MSHPFKSGEHGNDVQAILRSGFKSLEKCRYLLLRIEDPEKAARWIDELFAENLIKSVADIDLAKASDGFDEAVILAFTYAAA